MRFASLLVALQPFTLPNFAHADLPALIEALKPSVVVVGYFKATNSPRFNLSGTGFAVADGNLLITNAHVLACSSASGSMVALPASTCALVISRLPSATAKPVPDKLKRGLAGSATIDPDAQLQVLVRTGTQLDARNATVVEVDRAHDLALLRIPGAPLPALKLRDGSTVREGQSVAIMGFPIGSVLGFSPVTHRGIVSSIAPVAIPTASARLLNEKNIRSLRDGSFDIFQLDLTAYPGNSGGPLFDAETGEVIGVLNMVFVKGTRESALSAPSGISYAIPATHILPLLQRNAK